MKLRRLTARNFRNLVPAEIAFHDQTNIVVGRNGQGKTNLLEAIYVLVTTKSFRTAHMASLFRFAKPNLFVAVTVTSSCIDKTLSVGSERAKLRPPGLISKKERSTLSP